MFPKAVPPAALKFSVEALSVPDRLRALRALNEREVLAQDLAPFGGGKVRAEFVQRSFPGLGVLSAVMSGLRQQGNTGRAARGRDDDVFLGVNIAGCRTARQRGRETVAGEGHGLLLSRGNGAFVIDNPTTVQFVGLLMPRAKLSPLVPNLDQCICAVGLKPTDALDLLGKYVSAILADDAVVTPELQRLVGTQVYDLAAVAIGATRDAAFAAEAGGLRTARLRSIKSHVFLHFEDPSLSVQAVATQFKVTPRYIQKLFESEGTTFSEHVMEQRLHRAHHVLTDPRFAARAISSVAYESGFGDLSYFNRVFRRYYHATPSEVRYSGRYNDGV